MSDRITKTVQNLRALPPSDRLQAIFEDGSLLDVLLAAAEEREALREAWDSFGRHDDQCQGLGRPGMFCRCGYADARAKLEALAGKAAR